MPCLLHLLVLFLIACPCLPDTGSLGLAPPLAGLAAIEAGRMPAPDETPRMVRAVTDADDLREAFAQPIPYRLPVTMAVAVFGPMRTDRPDTRADHPPDRPPRRIA